MKVLRTIIFAFMIWPLVLLSQLVFLSIGVFIAWLGLPSQFGQVKYFLGRYECLFDVVPIGCHLFGMWVCIALTYMSVRLAMFVGRGYKFFTNFGEW